MPRRSLALVPLLIAGLARGGSAGELELARLDPARLDPGAAATKPSREEPAPPPAPDLELVLEQLPPDVAGGTRDASRPFDVEYTTDPALDADVKGILAHGDIALGQVIAMDPESGELLSWVATDPETFPVARAYPTASLMKVVTAAAVLRDAPEAAERTCRYVGSPYQVEAQQLVAPKTGGQVDTFEDALAISNNQCFARLAVHDLGREALLEEIERVGMLAPPAAGLPPGRVVPVEGELALGYLGSGLAGSFLSPLAAARLAAALARGDLIAPRWVARVRDAEGGIVAAPSLPEPQHIWPAEIVDALRASLRNVTERGTARRAFHDERGQPLLGEIEVAGKTGTLLGEDPAGLYQWFIGVAPADEPQVAIAAVVVHDPLERREITSAAKVAAETLRALFCNDRGCRGERIEQLRARARARDAETHAALVAQRIALAQARAAAVEVRPAHLVEAEDLELPTRLRRRRAEGEIVLRVSIASTGDISDVQVDSSDLPRFDEFVSEEVRAWKFAPSTRGGVPEASQVKLRIPIRVR